MDYRLLTPGDGAPQVINAVIEIPRGEGRVKYEYRADGTLVIDRLRGPNLPPYPIHYGGVPGTLAPDGDPLDVLVLGDDGLRTGDVIAVRPVGVLWMSDEKGRDPKILAVPADAVSEAYLHILRLGDVPEAQRQMLEEFFGSYKKNDIKGKWSKTHGWEDLDAALAIVLECMDRRKTHAG